MKKIKISSECSACGICVNMTDLLIENPDGTVSPAEAGIVQENQVYDIEKIIEECPSNAISLIEFNALPAGIKLDAKSLKEYISNVFKSISLPLPDPNSYRYSAESMYKARYSQIGKQGDYIFRSDRSAISEGLKHFDRYVYSQRNSIIHEELINYQTKYLAPFITYEKKESSYYYKINTMISQKMNELVNVLKENIENYPNEINNYAGFEIIPEFGYGQDTRSRECYVIDLKHLENTALPRRIKEGIEPLGWYDSFIDTDDTEDEKGRDIYSFRSRECEKQFNAHLSSEIASVLNAVDGVQKYINEFIKNHFFSKIEIDLSIYLKYFLSIVDKELTNTN